MYVWKYINIYKNIFCYYYRLDKHLTLFYRVGWDWTAARKPREDDRSDEDYEDENEEFKWEKCEIREHAISPIGSPQCQLAGGGSRQSSWMKQHTDQWYNIIYAVMLSYTP